MNLHRMLLQRAEAGKPLRVALIGAGKFGAMYLAQVPKTGGIGSAEVLIPAVAGAVLIIGFILRARRTSHPLIDLKLFRYRTFSISSVAMVLFMVAFFGAMLMFPLYYQTVRGAVKNI